MRRFMRVMSVCGLVADPELRTSKDGKPYAFLRAVFNYQVKGEKRASFFDISIFGKTAENAAIYLRKGSNVLVEGELQEDEFTGKDGQTRRKLMVFARDLTYLDPPNYDRKPGEQAAPKPTEVASNDEDDIPF